MRVCKVVMTKELMRMISSITVMMTITVKMRKKKKMMKTTTMILRKMSCLSSWTNSRDSTAKIVKRMKKKVSRLKAQNLPFLKITRSLNSHLMKESRDCVRHSPLPLQTNIRN